MTSAQKHFDYFESLERTIKIALAVYVFFLLAGCLLLAAAGVPELADLLLSDLVKTVVAATIFLALYEQRDGLLDAVSSGTLDGGHGVLVYHYGKQNALALWGSGPGWSMDANMLLA